MKKIIMNILIIIFALTFVFSVFKLTVFFIELYTNNKYNNSLIKKVVKIEKKDEDDDKIIVDFDSLLKINKDVKGWIRFNDYISYPILQSTDNDYYLKRTIEKKKNSLGSIFMDFTNNSFFDKNVVLYGHNSKDGSMFGSLSQTLKNGFFDIEENKIIEIIDVDNTVKHYEIFSVYTIIKEDYYITTHFDNDEEYIKFLNTIKKRSFKKFDVELSEIDHILTLSTCNGVAGTDKRLVVHARLID